MRLCIDSFICKCAPLGARRLLIRAGPKSSARAELACAAQDYARLHSYKVIATSGVADPSLDNMWNKVGWLLKAYHVRLSSKSSSNLSS